MSATDLCSACGICCNGVMFYKVRLRSSDSPREIMALGLRWKRKGGEQFILQPCPAHQAGRCAVYAQRPERCQRFECRQLKRVSKGEIEEADALEKIREVTDRVAQVEALLEASGKTDPKNPLAKRFEKITAEPVDPGGDPNVVKLRAQLTLAMQELDELIERDFR